MFFPFNPFNGDIKSGAGRAFLPPRFFRHSWEWDGGRGNGRECRAKFTSRFPGPPLSEEWAKKGETYSPSFLPWVLFR
ncbi:MAG: hypothetical protein C6W57_04210 [Caldibacillus debilis]|nr:hypothetical protein [Bacillaceae bacterium]MBY6272722.1 hypothetical protein [Bacillaceae bacterium]OUM86993.1 MAG: hypothetical protein BAA03_04075 [Caldibacillus debilis]REJ18085.1 MAG: hypothetical protein C6W57_04210 [Caldibacillus debilis]REJ30312.1 MAG: hypothetical protein C6W56_03585 [Caldibacillus debilis]